jgi:diphthamide synthase (EF-2-diphthine--ammonia ligase)
MNVSTGGTHDACVAELFTTEDTASGRVRGHDVHGALLDRQVAALGYPHRTVPLPDSEGTYERHLGAFSDAYDRRGIDRVVYADLYVESIREYRESLLADHVLTGHWPLWGRDTDELAHAFFDEGLEATVVRADADVLPESAVCRDYDRMFLADHPWEVDPCSENGAFQTFVRDGPLFDVPVAVDPRGRHTETVERGAHGGSSTTAGSYPAKPTERDGVRRTGVRGEPCKILLSKHSHRSSR